MLFIHADEVSFIKRLERLLALSLLSLSLLLGLMSGNLSYCVFHTEVFFHFQNNDVDEAVRLVDDSKLYCTPFAILFL